MHVRPIALVCAVWLLLAAVGRVQDAPAATDASARLILANDNRQAAGILDKGILTIKLVAGQGEWRPEGPKGRTLSVQAFREEIGRLTIPGPLVRVPAGTQIHAAIRNDIPGTTLTMFGMGDRAAGVTSTLRVPAGETREVRFAAPEPGTYHYWASTTDRSLQQRRDLDSQLGGALVVDPPGARTDDRVFVLGLWRKPGTAVGAKPVEIGTINGRSWPDTERFDHHVGDVVRWRVVNLTHDQHAMHLHGNYFDVMAIGDGLVSRTYAPGEQRHVVTEHMFVGETIDMQWTPRRAGNWLFHCHMVIHMMPPVDVNLGGAQHHAEDSSAGMAGLVLGIRVTGNASPTAESSTPPRRFTLKMREEPNRYGNVAGYRVDVEGLETTRVGPGPVPAPVIALTRGEPIEVALVNGMTEPTAIHWHGIELESYFDGVPGWGGTPGNVTPAIGVGQTFTAKFTPPRAGTFIYHTHWHDEAQLGGGLYGALIVLEPGQRYDPATDHVFIVGFDGPVVLGKRRPYVLNGSSASVPAPAPGPVETLLRADVPNRLRLINITPNNTALTFILTDGFKPVAWKPVAKDGADLPPTQTASREAQQLVSVGETYDFEIQPKAAQRLWLEVRMGSGAWVAQALLVAGP
jgi:manganese oxidase